MDGGRYVGQRVRETGVVDAAFGDLAVDGKLNRCRPARPLAARATRHMEPELRSAPDRCQRLEERAELTGKRRPHSGIEFQPLHFPPQVPLAAYGIEQGIDLNPLQVVAAERALNAEQRLPYLLRTRLRIDC